MAHRERADAARNRRAILLAAHRLICENGIDQVSMSDIAAEAGVGKGTLFRRFGDRAGLVNALFEQLTEDWEPDALAALADSGTDPAGRAVAFLAGLFDRITVPGRPLLRAMGNHATPDRMRRYRTWQSALAAVIAEARPGLPEEETAFTAHVLLGTLRADFVDLLSGGGMTVEEIRTRILAHADRVIRSGPSGG
ncbi:TetR/AcrR family transcriptional regulator [Actinomadura rugatobispora]|uniref:TetR/AcrR family transcriptional regulator n=1 Tax=Actinomadura rugatobispora TaxID=1994 RepID=A0ABW1ABL9_9ACTN|nr:TetR/AcrR family transcriptional regulator [Actinomadura rugatobispora]